MRPELADGALVRGLDTVDGHRLQNLPSLCRTVPVALAGRGQSWCLEFRLCAAHTEQWAKDVQLSDRPPFLRTFHHLLLGASDLSGPVHRERNLHRVAMPTSPSRRPYGAPNRQVTFT